jgi:hypothetical protein
MIFVHFFMQDQCIGERKAGQNQDKTERNFLTHFKIKLYKFWTKFTYTQYYGIK